MRRLLALALLLAWPASAQYARNVTTETVNVDGSSSSSSSVPTPTVADDGKVLAVDSSGAYVLTAVSGTGTVTSVTLTVPSIFSVTGSPITTAGTFAIALANQNANLVFAGPVSGGAAAPAFRALVALDLGNFTLSPSLRMLTLQDATGDTTPLTVRASSGAGAAPIIQWQASDNSPLGNIAHDGSIVANVTGNVTGNVSGSSGSTTGNAATASALATDPTACTAGDFVTDVAADGTLTCDTPAGGGGITNAAGANVIPKSDGTNLVASNITDDGTNISFAVSPLSPGAGANSWRAGSGAVAAGDNAVAIGYQASAANGQGVAIGYQSSAVGPGGVALGDRAVSSANSGVAIGLTARAGQGGVAVGYNAQAVATGGDGAGMAIGDSSLANGLVGIVIGAGASAAGKHGVVMGYQAALTGHNQLVIGGADATYSRIADVYIGDGVTNAVPLSTTYHATGGSGTNVAGAPLIWASGAGTGTANASYSGVKGDALGGSSGATANPTVYRAIFNLSGKALTSGAASSLFDVPLPASPSSSGGQIMYTIRATDGTAEQVTTGLVKWVVRRTGAGPTYASTVTPETEVTSASSGTLTTAWAFVAGTNKVTMQVTPTVGTITPTLIELVTEVHSQGRTDIVPLPF